MVAAQPDDPLVLTLCLPRPLPPASKSSSEGPSPSSAHAGAAPPAGCALLRSVSPLSSSRNSPAWLSRPRRCCSRKAFACHASKRKNEPMPVLHMLVLATQPTGAAALGAGHRQCIKASVWIAARCSCKGTGRTAPELAVCACWKRVLKEKELHACSPPYLRERGDDVGAVGLALAATEARHALEREELRDAARAHARERVHLRAACSHVTLPDATASGVLPEVMQHGLPYSAARPRAGAPCPASGSSCLQSAQSWACTVDLPRPVQICRHAPAAQQTPNMAG